MSTSRPALRAPYRPAWEDLELVAASALQHRGHLHEILRGLPQGGLMVAFSGGVDSSYLLHEASGALGDTVVAVTALSPSLGTEGLDRARRIASSLGVRLLELPTHEVDDPDYRKNGPDRCYFCKNELFTRLAPLASTLGVHTIAYGAIADDLGDHRPGARAAEQHGARAPLQEAGLTKNEIRWLSREADLPTWDLPSQACLSSRFAYGQPIDAARLRAVEDAEAFIRRFGVHQVRVRHHGSTARIEVDAENIAFLASPDVRAAVVEHLEGLGYAYVSLDLNGFRSGSMNLVLRSARGGENGEEA